MASEAIVGTKIKIFDVTDADTVAAESAEQAAAYIKEISDYSDEDMRELADEGYPREIPESDWDTRKIMFDLSGTPVATTVTWRAYLESLIANGTEFPTFFCTDEW